eukprot:GHUV01038185.1.p1 GENE.GHUV01038185.1~~GHUV01038185.1.p1  ORF type:complete len:116 (+),score=23.12 GHUV01038185.1:213-560(+)
MLNSQRCQEGSIRCCRQAATPHQTTELIVRRTRSLRSLDEPRRPRSSTAAAAISRRAALSGAAGAAIWGPQLPARALRTIELKDGSHVEVYEHGMTLSIVALRGSLPEQWVVEFR